MIRHLFVFCFFFKTALYLGGAGVFVMNYEAPSAEEKGFNFCQLPAVKGKSDMKNEWEDFQQWCKAHVWDMKDERPTYSQAAYLWWHNDRVQKCNAYPSCVTHLALGIFTATVLAMACAADYVFSLLLVRSFFLGASTSLLAPPSDDRKQDVENHPGIQAQPGLEPEPEPEVYESAPEPESEPELEPELMKQVSEGEMLNISYAEDVP